MTEKPASKGKVLVVDDNRDTLDLISLYLSGNGYDVDIAPGGREALAKVESGPPDVVILDIMMPDMDGYEVTTAIKRSATRRQIPVILASARTTADDVLAGLVMGADDYITKPFDMDVLLARVQIQMRVKDLRDRLATAEGMIGQVFGGAGATAQHLADLADAFRADGHASPSEAERARLVAELLGTVDQLKAFLADRQKAWRAREEND